MKRTDELAAEIVTRLQRSACPMAIFITPQGVMALRTNETHSEAMIAFAFERYPTGLIGTYTEQANIQWIRDDVNSYLET